MRGWPVQPRGGFTGFLNEVLARALGELTAEQLRLFIGLVYAAEFKREGSTSPDGRWRVAFGQVLVSYDSLAAAYGVKRDVVRRALRRFEEVALATAGRPVPATPDATAPATAPTVVTLGTWFGICAAAGEPTTAAASPGATAPAIAPATIQHRNTGTPEGTAPRASAREREDLVAEKDQIVAEGEACDATWGAIVRGPAERMRLADFVREFQGVRGRVVGGVLRVEVPGKDRAREWRQRHVEGLHERASLVRGVETPVDIVAGPELMARVAGGSR
jgi:hypothetical protein